MLLYDLVERSKWNYGILLYTVRPLAIFGHYFSLKLKVNWTGKSISDVSELFWMAFFDPLVHWDVSTKYKNAFTSTGNGTMVHALDLKIQKRNVLLLYFFPPDFYKMHSIHCERVFCSCIAWQNIWTRTHQSFLALDQWIKYRIKAKRRWKCNSSCRKLQFDWPLKKTPNICGFERINNLTEIKAKKNPNVISAF